MFVAGVLMKDFVAEKTVARFNLLNSAKYILYGDGQDVSDGQWTACLGGS